MKITQNINQEWYFKKGDSLPVEVPSNGEEGWMKVELPHSWNNWDGQDGGN